MEDMGAYGTLHQKCLKGENVLNKMSSKCIVYY